MPRARDSDDEDDVPTKGKNDAEEDVEDDDEVEEEYEIEAVLDFKPDVFGKDKPGYFVKWVGYPDSDNSWVRPEDAGNAQQLIDDYNAKKAAKKRGRPSRPVEPEPESEEAAEPEPESEPERATTSRRKSTTASASAPAPLAKKKPKKNLNKVETDEEEDEESARPAAASTGKRGRKSNGTASASRAKRQRTKEAEAEDEAIEALQPSTMSKFKDRDSWEGVVERVDTVERGDKNTLLVFFRLKGIKEPCVENSDLCKKKFPQKLLDFYERNLRWKTAEEDEDDA